MTVLYDAKIVLNLTDTVTVLAQNGEPLSDSGRDIASSLLCVAVTHAM